MTTAPAAAMVISISMVKGMPFRGGRDGAPGDGHEAHQHGGEEQPRLHRRDEGPDAGGRNQSEAAQEGEARLAGGPPSAFGGGDSTMVVAAGFGVVVLCVIVAGVVVARMVVVGMIVPRAALSMVVCLALPAAGRERSEGVAHGGKAPGEGRKVGVRGVADHQRAGRHRDLGFRHAGDAQRGALDLRGAGGAVHPGHPEPALNERSGHDGGLSLRHAADPRCSSH